MKFFLVIIICPLFLNAQTVIIAKKTKNAIYVGADSRGNVPYYNSFRQTVQYVPVDTLCKIQSSGKFNFAVCGIGFPIAMEECKKASIGKKNFDALIEAFIPAFIGRLKDTLERLRIERFLGFKEILKRIPEASNQIGSTIFFGVDADTLFLAVLTYSLISTLEKPVELSINGGTVEMSLAGHTKEIREIARKEATWKTGIPDAINRLINIEMDYHPSGVGGPIDMLKVTTTKNTWIQRYNVPCP